MPKLIHIIILFIMLAIPINSLSKSCPEFPPDDSDAWWSSHPYEHGFYVGAFMIDIETSTDVSTTFHTTICRGVCKKKHDKSTEISLCLAGCYDVFDLPKGSAIKCSVKLIETVEKHKNKEKEKK